MPTTLDHAEDVSTPSLPRLREGVELLGEVKGSGLREPPYLIRRPDEQVVQLSRLLYLVAASLDGTRDHDEIAERVSEELGRRMTGDQVRFVLDEKLASLGILAGAGGVTQRAPRPDPLLGLRFRIPAVPPRVVRRIADLFRPLFLPPIVVCVLAALVAFDVWLLTGSEISRSVLRVLYEPTLMLVLIAVGWLSVAFHEFGHAAACRYGGATPSRMGVGIYLIWPVFYTDVTDSYRLDRAGRVRVDLGGVYFNAVLAVVTAGIYLLTGFEPLVIVILMQQLVVIDQFLPWLRFDGYYVISDLIGVSDLFARIKPTLLSLVPGREAHPGAKELKPWARAAIAAWVLTIVPVFAGMVYIIVTNVPRYFAVAWDSFFRQVDRLGEAAQSLAVIDGVASAVGAGLLLIPWLGLVMTYLLLCTNTGKTLASAETRARRSTPPAPQPAAAGPPGGGEPSGGERPDETPPPRQDDRADEAYTIAQAAAATGLSRKAIRNRVDRGRLRAVLRDGLRYIPRSELERAGLTVDATSPRVARDDEPPVTDPLRGALDRLERQAGELAELRLLTGEADRLRGERDRLEAALRQSLAKLSELEARLAEAEAAKARLGELEARLAEIEGRRPRWRRSHRA